jgi:hypothetical protein
MNDAFSLLLTLQKYKTTLYKLYKPYELYKLYELLTVFITFAPQPHDKQ